MDNTKNKIGAIFLGLILLTFIIGGYFLMRYIIKNPNNEKNIGIKEVKKDVRINNKKDYIYLENSEEIIDEVFESDLVLNIKGLEEENNKLKTELENLSKDKVNVTNEEIPEGTTCENKLYSFSYRNYDIAEYDKYISVVIIDYDYNCVNGTVPKNIKSYVINKEEGILVTNEELYTLFNISEDSIIKGVSKRLSDTQVLDGDENIIDTEKTLNNIKSSEYGTNKALSISKNGKLVINFIVNSNKINYNDSIELN